MTRRARRARLVPRLATLATLATLAKAGPVAAAVPATAAAPHGHDTWLEAGPLAGGLGLDGDLADYRWDTRPAPLWGGRVLAGRGPLAVGVNGWTAHTTQETGLPGAPVTPRVALTTVAAIGLVRAASPAGCELWLGAQAGRLHAGWEPDELVVEGAGDPVTVTFAGVDTWCLGPALELRRQLAPALQVSLQAERSSWSLETAHRAGQDIEYRRDHFANWTARLQVAWRWRL
jgi:hypothetical protein